MMSGVSKRVGLPLSLQFVGRAHDEATLLRVAAGYERATQWSAYRPPRGSRQPMQAAVASRPRLKPEIKQEGYIDT